MAAALRIAWVVYSQAEPNFETGSADYLLLAQSIREGHGFVTPSGEPTAWYAPGYPALLAALSPTRGVGPGGAQALNVALGTATALLAYWLAGRLFDKRVAAVAAVLVALTPGQIILSAVALPEVAFTAVALGALLVAVIALQRRNHAMLSTAGLYLASGVLFGFGALMRPPALVLPIVVAALVLATKRERAALGAAALVLGALIIVAPWLARNAARIDAIGPIDTAGGMHFEMGHHAGASGHNEPAERFLAAYGALDTPARETAANRDGYRQGLEYARGHLPIELANLFRKAFWLFGDDEVAMQLNENYGRDPWLTMFQRDYWFTFSNVYYYALLLFGAIGLALSRLGRHPARMAAFVFMAGWIAVHLLFYGDPRFHLPLVPVMAVFAAASLVAVFRTLRAESAGEPVQVGDLNPLSIEY